MKRLAALLTIVIAASPAPAAAQTRQPPYMASIASGQAMMRTGPGRNYPGTWLYVRRDLPIRVVEIYRDWRRIEDPDGTRGWMLVAMLSDQRTAIVRPGDPRPLREAPDEGAPVRFRAEPGVVGRVSRCAGGWCHFDVHGRAGYVRVDQIWGVGADETVR